MNTRVTVDANLSIKNVFEPPLQIELGDGRHTLGDVLQALSRMCPFLRFVEKGQMGDDLRHVFVNGESHFSFPTGLKREIHDGDTIRVEAYMDPLAGG